MAAATDTSLGSLAGMGVGAAAGGPMGAMVGGTAGGLLGSLFGGGVDQEALDALRKAQDAINAIPVPTAQDMQLVLQPLVQQGVLTPQAYSTILEQPSAFTNINLDETARNAELAGLSQLQDIAQEGGMDAQYRAAMTDAINSSNTQLQGQNGSVLQNAQARGMGNSDLAAAEMLSNNMSGANLANTATTNAASQAEQRALQALAESATLGGNINAQDYSQAAQKAQAIDAINKYNAQNTQQQANTNTQQTNEAQGQNLDLAQQIAQYNNQLKNKQTQYNAELPQQVFADQLTKGQALLGSAQPVANLLQSGNQAQATTQGNLIGGLGQNLTNYYNNQNLTNALSKLRTPSAVPPAQTTPAANYANTGAVGGWGASDGGEVPGDAPMPGDHPANDNVLARVSPGEVIVPRTAAKDPFSLASFIAHLPQGNTPKIRPEDVKTVLQALSAARAGMSYGGEVC